MRRERIQTGAASVPEQRSALRPRTDLWRIGQVIALAATLALVAGLFRAPEAALSLLWDVAIPILPAVFLVNPALWRNVCPLGTLNMLTNGWGAHAALPDRLLPAAGAIGIVLLAVMVPARRFLFNANGPALAFTILAVAALALLLGAFFARRAGFCNAICPVLPVERLYGQNPLIAVGNARCGSCRGCVSRGCIDLAKTHSIAQTLGPSRLSHDWLQSVYGIFAAAFPGFVLGYYLVPDGPLDSAGTVYFTVAACSGASYLLAQVVVRILKLGSVPALRLLAALAIGLYYWFAAAVVAGHLGFPDWAPAAIRILTMILIALWLWRMDWPRLVTRAPT